MVIHCKVKREQNRAEERERLLARFGTGPEVLNLLNSEAGDKLIRALAPRGKHPLERLGGELTGSLVTLFTGLAFRAWHAACSSGSSERSLAAARAHSPGSHRDLPHPLHRL